MILAVDPGQHNGYCLVSFTGKKEFIVDKFGTMEKALFFKWLEEELPPIDLMVVEDFKTRPNEARRGTFDWNQMVAPKVIGALEYVASVLKIPLKLQQPAIKPVGYAYLGKDYKQGKANMHHWDALAHAMYYCVTNRLVIPNSSSIAVITKPSVQK